MALTNQILIGTNDTKNKSERPISMYTTALVYTGKKLTKAKILVLFREIVSLKGKVED